MFTASLFCVMALLGGLEDAKNASKSDFQSMEGTWNITAWEVSGEEVPAQKRPELFVIAGLRIEGLGNSALFIQIDPSKTPRWFDLVPNRLDEKRAIKGIYELKGDSLKICIPDTRGGKKTHDQRPDSFETKNKDRLLMTLKRAKDRNATLAVPLTHL